MISAKQLAWTAVVPPRQVPQPLGDPLGGQMAAAVLEAFSDLSYRAIMDSIISTGKCIDEIAEENDAPVSTTYRRVHELRRKGLIIVERIILSSSGKKRAIFRSAFEGARIEVQPEGVVVVGIPNGGIPDIALRLWQFKSTDPGRPKLT